MRPPKRKRDDQGVLEVPPELLAPPVGGLSAQRRWSEDRRRFVTDRGLPGGWWFFWSWAPAARRQFLESGGTSPPKREAGP